MITGQTGLIFAKSYRKGGRLLAARHWEEALQVRAKSQGPIYRVAVIIGVSSCAVVLRAD
jgi:hypothetical protein